MASANILKICAVIAVISRLADAFSSNISSTHGEYRPTVIPMKSDSDKGWSTQDDLNIQIFYIEFLSQSLSKF